MKLPKVIINLPNHEYHSGKSFREFISSTQLKNYLVSPKYAKYMRENPKEISLSASLRGSVYHSRLASLCNYGNFDEGFDNEYFVFDPPINPSTGNAFGIESKKYGEALTEAKSLYNGKECCSYAEVELADKMIEELLNNCGSTSESVQQIIRLGKAEVSHFCEFEGAKFKYRPDVRTNNKIIDWKTIDSEDLHMDTIMRQILKFDYHISAAFYMFFDKLIYGKTPEFYWVFQQKRVPYDAVIVDASQLTFAIDGFKHEIANIGAMQLEELIKQHITCSKSNYYPGAEIFISPNHKGRRVMNLKPSSYLLNNQNIFYNE